MIIFLQKSHLLFLFFVLSSFGFSSSKEKEWEKEAEIEEQPSASLDEPLQFRKIDQIIEISKPKEKIDLEKNKLRSYVVGFRNPRTILSLYDAKKQNLLSEEEIHGLSENLNELSSGDISTIRFLYGGKRGEDIIFGRYPDKFIPQSVTMETMNYNNPEMRPFLKWLQVLDHMVNLQPQESGGGVSLGFQSFFLPDAQLYAMTLALSSYYYSQDHHMGVDENIYASGQGLNFSIGMTAEEWSNSFWFGISQGWLGFGYSFRTNLDHNDLGLTALGGGVSVSGWKDYVQLGASISIVGNYGWTYGVGGAMTLSKDRRTHYIKPYTEEYDLLIKTCLEAHHKKEALIQDEITVTQQLLKFVSESESEHLKETLEKDLERLAKEKALVKTWTEAFIVEKAALQGSHLVEVIDSHSESLRLNGGFNVNGVGMAFRGGKQKAKKSIYRFYAPMERAQELLKDGDGSKIALLRLPEHFDIKTFPDIRHPGSLRIGEEVITSIDRTFYGALVVGFQPFPGIDIRSGISSTVTGTFEVGIRKLPGNKLELSIKPSEIREMGAFLAAINVIGPQLSGSETVALIMKMIFILDLHCQDAMDAYSQFLTSGILPLNFSAKDAVTGEEEAQNFLDAAKIYRKKLKPKGIFIKYLEKMDIPAKKFYAGLAKIPALNAWNGLSYEFLKGQARVVSTDGSMSLLRLTSQWSKSRGRGRSGQEEKAAYATIQKAYIKETQGPEDGFRSRFKGLMLRVVFSDTKITGSDQIKMVEKLNRMFRANIGPFLDKHGDISHKQTREIILERQIGEDDFIKIQGAPIDRVEDAAGSSKIARHILLDLQSDLIDKGLNQMAEMIKTFVGYHGVKGVAAIHMMLGGNFRDLVIITTSNAYTDPIKKALDLSKLYTNPKSDGLSRYLDVDYDTPKRKVREIFHKVDEVIEDLDQALLDLNADPLMEGEDDFIRFDKGQRQKKGPLRSMILASKNQLLSLIDMDHQKFDLDLMIVTYKKISPKKRSLLQRLVLLESSYSRPIGVQEKRKKIGKRWEDVHEYLSDIKKERKKYSHPHKKRILTESFVLTYLEYLKEYKKRAKNLIRLDHLKGDFEVFQKRLEKPPVASSYREILSYMDALEP